MYIRILGRAPLYDRFNQLSKSVAPGWLVTIARRLLQMPRHLHARLVWRRELRLLPLTLRPTFEALYLASRKRWDTRQSAATGLPLNLPLIGGPYLLTVRPGTSDVLAYADIVLRGQYAVPIPWRVRTIVDAGANIGIASAFFLNRYPDARVVAIEPDPVNAALCRQNLAQFGARCVVLEAALTPTPTRVRLAPDLRGTWGAQVTLGGGDIEGIDLPTLVDRFQMAYVDILKIDIEGSERPLFEHPDRRWVEIVGAFMVELESPASERAFFGAVDKQLFQFVRSGEIISAVRATLPVVFE